MKKAKIKILHLIPTLNKGGAERLLVDLCKQLDQSQFEVEVLSLKTLGQWGLELKKAGIPVASLGKKNTGSLWALWRLYKILKDQQPDILHTHLFGADLYGSIAGRLARVPRIVSTEHNLNFGESRLRRSIKKMIVPRLDKVIAVSGAVKSYLAQEGINDGNIELIHNGIDLDRFTPQTSKDNSRGLIIGSVGRLTAQKDYDTLIEAMAILNNENISCLLAGAGEEKDKLACKVKKYGLTNRFIFLGQQNEIPKFLSQLDIFVLPSRWEGFGLVVLEAGATELPVIASRVDGLKEIIRDQVNGLFFEPGNAADLAARISDLAADQEKRKRLAAQLYQDTRANFSIGRMVAEYERAYLDLSQTTIKA